MKVKYLGRDLKKAYATDADVSDEEPMVSDTSITESVTPEVVSEDPCESENKNFSHTQNKENEPGNLREAGMKKKIICYFKILDTEEKREEVTKWEHVPSEKKIAKSNIRPISLEMVTKSRVLIGKSRFIYVDLIGSGISSGEERTVSRISNGEEYGFKQLNGTIGHLGE